MGMSKAKQKKAKAQMLEQLELSLGVIDPACRVVGITRKTYYDWIRTDLEFKEAAEAIGEKALDFVEYELYKQIRNGNTAATIFYLKTKGRKRGYIEQYNLNTTIVPLNIEIGDFETQQKLLEYDPDRLELLDENNNEII